MRVSTLLALGCAVLAAALGAWLLAGRPGRDAPEPVGATENAREIGARAPPAMRGSPNPAAAPERTADAPPSRWLLRGRLVGLDAREAPRVSVLAAGLAATPRDDGTFEIDVTARISVVPRPGELVVTAEHPDHLRAQVGVEVPARADADPAVLECVIPMQRAASVWVRVVGEAGDGIAAAAVGAFPMRGDLPDAWPCDVARTDATGAARVRVPAEGSAALLAASEGRRPASVVVAGDAPGAPTVSLAAGAGIEGRVREDGRALAGAVLLVQADSSGRQQLHLGDDEYRWEPGSVAPALVAATTDAQGRYRADGLAAWDYRVRVDRLADGRKPVGFARAVLPPASDVDFDLSLGHVALTVTDRGSPVAGASIYVFAGGFAHRLETDARGEAHADLAADEAYTGQVDRDGFRTAHVEFRSPAAGARQGVAVSLEAIAPHGTLAVVVRTSEGKAISPAGLAFFPADAAEESQPEVRFGRARDGRFPVGDVAAGRYRLVVRPGRYWDPDFTWDYEGATWLDATTSVEVPREGETEVVVVARPGARLRIDARDAADRFLTPTCTLHDASGEAVSFDVATRLGENGGYSFGGQTLGIGAPSDVAAALPAGRYRLDLALEGYVDRSMEVDLEAGAVRTVRVTLERLHGAGPDRPPPVPAGGDR